MYHACYSDFRSCRLLGVAYSSDCNDVGKPAPMNSPLGRRRAQGFVAGRFPRMETILRADVSSIRPKQKSGVLGMLNSLRKTLPIPPTLEGCSVPHS